MLSTPARFLFALSLVALVAFPVFADKPTTKPKLEGSFSRSIGEGDVTLDFSGGLLKIVINTSGAELTSTSDYGVTKDGVLFGVMTKVDAKGIDNPPEVGFPFSFKVERKDDELTVSELRGTDSDVAKRLMEGKYKKK